MNNLQIPVEYVAKLYCSPFANILFSPCAGSGQGKERNKENIITLLIVLFLLLTSYVALYSYKTSTAVVETVISYTMTILQDLLMTLGKIHDVCLWSSLVCLQGKTQREIFSLRHRIIFSFSLSLSELNSKDSCKCIAKYIFISKLGVCNYAQFLHRKVISEKQVPLELESYTINSQRKIWLNADWVLEGKKKLTPQD